MIRRQFLRNSLGTVAAAAGIHTLSSCGGTKSTGGRGQITLGSYADPALDILKDVLLPEFEISARGWNSCLPSQPERMAEV